MADKQYFKDVKTKGRPKKILTNYGCETVEKLASMMMTDEEIASIMGVSTDTLVGRNNKEAYAEAKTKGMANGKASLRRAQFKSALAGNTTMLIWLGKQHLDQKERQETSVVDGNITFEIAPASSGKKTGELED